MPATRSQQQAGSASLAPFAFFVGIIGIGVAAWKGYPGVPVLLAALVISAILEKPPLMTGRKVPGRGAQPAGEKEEDLQASYQMWRSLRWRLLVPTLDWLPGWPPRASWFAAVAAAWTSIALPVKEPVYALANPPAMFIVVAVMTAAMRRKSGSPGLRLNTFPFRLLALLSGLAGAAAGAAAGKYGPPKIEEAVPGLEFGPPMVIVSGLAFLGFLAGLYPAVSVGARRHGCADRVVDGKPLDVREDRAGFHRVIEGFQPPMQRRPPLRLDARSRGRRAAKHVFVLVAPRAAAEDADLGLGEREGGRRSGRGFRAMIQHGGGYLRADARIDGEDAARSREARGLAKVTAILCLVGGGILLVQLLALGALAFLIPTLGYVAYATVCLTLVYGVFLLWTMNQADVQEWLASRTLRD